MKQALHTAMVNIILQDPKDRFYLTSIKKFLDSIPPENLTEDPDLQETAKFVNKLIDSGIDSKQEVLFHISTVPYSTMFKATLDDTETYTSDYKSYLLKSLTAELMVQNIRPYIDSINSDLNRIEYDYTSKEGADASTRILNYIQSLRDVSENINLDIGKSNILVIDPLAETVDKTVMQTVTSIQEQAAERVKVSKPIDMMVGGGFAPDTLTLFAAITGRGKSLIMHNIALYASKNNKRDQFDTDLTPCILFVSLELTREKLFRRHLAWCGVSLSEEEIKKMSETEVAELILTASKRMGLNIPIIYVERLKGTDSKKDGFTTTNHVDVANEISNYKRNGFEPIIVIVDYVDRMDVTSLKHAQLGMSGSDGSNVLRQKCKELRDLAIDYNIPVISAIQLNGMAMSMMAECEPYYKYIDILQNFKDDWTSSSKQLGTEVETLVFCHTFGINETVLTESGNDTVITNKYLSMRVMKDRDDNARYIRSKRDDMWESAYLSHLNAAKVGRPYSHLLKTSSLPHVVMAMNAFRIVDDDWGRSITMFYPDENAGRTESYSQVAEEVNEEQKLEELYSE